MEIPNYDIDNKNKKFKQLYSFMPNDTFRMLICGNSGSGKTNLLYHMLIEPLLYYDKIYLYAKNLEQEKYQNLMKEMNEASNKEAGYNVKLFLLLIYLMKIIKKLSYLMIMFVKKIREKLLIILFKADTKIVLLSI